MIKLVAMTTLCVDIFDGTGEVRPGGEALNFSAIASEHEHIDASIIGGIGDDDLGEKVQLSIANKRINKDSIHILKGIPTASNRIYLTKQGERYFKDDSWSGGAYASFILSDHDKAKVLKSDIVFINYASPNFNEILDLRMKSNFKLAVDFNVERDFNKIDNFVEYIDFFFISGDDRIRSIFKTWSEKYDGIYNMTLAEKGSVTYKNGLEYCVDAIAVDKIVDTTGCGDSYHAGFVCSYVKNNNIIEAMNEGSKAASITLSHYGGFIY